LKFAAGEYDSVLGTYHFGLRYYSTNDGRWLAQDPVGFAGKDANLYRYSYNSPTTYIDPSGTVFSWITTAIGAGIGAAVGAVAGAGVALWEGKNWGEVGAAAAGGAAGGAVSGAIVGAAAGTLTGDVSAGLVIAGTIAANTAAGAAGAAISSGVQQAIVNNGNIDGEAVRQSFIRGGYMGMFFGVLQGLGQAFNGAMPAGVPIPASCPVQAGAPATATAVAPPAAIAVAPVAVADQAILQGVGVVLTTAPPAGGSGAPVGNPPPGAKILQTDPNGKWVIFENADGVKKIQFDVSEASNLAKGPLGPPRGSPPTGAAVGPNGKVVVVEGMHRLEAAQGGAQIPVGQGGISGLPGWLEYDLWPPPPP
jgi:RHS repeat-associated protein